MSWLAYGQMPASTSGISRYHRLAAIPNAANTSTRSPFSGSTPDCGEYPIEYGE